MIAFVAAAVPYEFRTRLLAAHGHRMFFTPPVYRRRGESRIEAVRGGVFLCLVPRLQLRSRYR
jgi:hypothetical protein